jgi:CBS domain-containing membrane protein
MDFNGFLSSFKPHAPPVTPAEKWRSALAAGLAVLLMGLTLKLLPQIGYPPVMLASMAATAAILFAMPHSPVAQPWPVVGGHLFSALVAWGCSWLIPDPVIAGGCAVGLSLLLMHYLLCLHPSGAATALIVVLNAPQFHHQGWQWIAYVVAANALLSLLLGLLINNLIPGRRYPSPPAQPRPAMSGVAIAIEPSDLEWAASQMEGMLDVSVEDLTEIYQLAARHADERYLQALKTMEK